MSIDGTNAERQLPGDLFTWLTVGHQLDDQILPIGELVVVGEQLPIGVPEKGKVFPKAEMTQAVV
jgi:hypothetical protein